MILILDANIVFSSILKPRSIIAGVLLDPENGIIFLAPAFLESEIKKHIPRLCLLTGFQESRINLIVELIFSKILFYPNEVIPDNVQIHADKICETIDPKDSIYIAFALFFQSKIWSGDRKLIDGLKRKGIDLLLDTPAVLELVGTLNK
jgi:predicted nucleic acid-binding protein